MLRFPIPLAGLLFSLTACAGSAVAPAEVAPADAAINRMAGKVMTEENLTLFFGLLRQSLTAAAEGKPAPELSAEDKARIEASSKQLQHEALEASMKMLDQVEKEMRETIRAESLGK